MRRVLAAAVLAAAIPTANAQDKGKAEFTPSAEFRVRYFLLDNPGANENTLSGRSHVDSRFKLNLGFKASEKVSGTFTLLHNADFGVDDNADNASSSGADATNSRDNLASVNQAFGTWMAADDLMFMVGRMNLQLGDGTLIGLNDWQKNPYTWEGLLAGYEQEFGKFWLAAIKLRNIQTTAGASHPATGSSASGDPEHNAYILAFDLKTMPEWMKTMHVHVVKNNGDALVGATAGHNWVANTEHGVDTMRYGTNLGFGFGAIDLKAWYEGQSGKLVQVATGTGDKTNLDYEGNMWAAQLGYTAESFMSSRFFVHYGVASGDSDTTNNSLDGYDPYAYEKHGAVGMMDLFYNTNITQIKVGWTFKTDDKTDLGLQYLMLSRTEASATSQTITKTSDFGNDLLTAANDKDKLGDEIDLWATHNYGDGLATTLRLGYFMPGDFFKDATTNNSDDPIMHVMIEGKATF